MSAILSKIYVFHNFTILVFLKVSTHLIHIPISSYFAYMLLVDLDKKNKNGNYMNGNWKVVNSHILYIYINNKLEHNPRTTLKISYKKIIDGWWKEKKLHLDVKWICDETFRENSKLYISIFWIDLSTLLKLRIPGISISYSTTVQPRA